jgi:hypothetical protein
MERERPVLEDFNNAETEEATGISYNFYGFYNDKTPSARIGSS